MPWGLDESRRSGFHNYLLRRPLARVQSEPAIAASNR